MATTPVDSGGTQSAPSPKPYGSGVGWNCETTPAMAASWRTAPSVVSCSMTALGIGGTDGDVIGVAVDLDQRLGRVHATPGYDQPAAVGQLVQ